MSYTEGPWTRDRSDGRFRHDHSAGVRGPDGSYIAAALDFNRTDRDEEVEANAAAIAILPTLIDVVMGFVTMGPHPRVHEWDTVSARATRALDHAGILTDALVRLLREHQLDD